MSTRFGFGKNWSQFLSSLDDQRIGQAKVSLQEMLELSDLSGKRFLDIGSGSGLFSLAAHELGAHVVSFDYDIDSVECTKTLKEKYASSSSRWEVFQGSVLDKSLLAKLGAFDIVYSWGVLHHTGQMWQALENVIPSVQADGTLFIAIYNDQGGISKFWTLVKRTYNNHGIIVRFLLLLLFGTLFETVRFFKRLIQGKNPFPWTSWAEKKKDRGMSVLYDLIDWIGGYPFEVAKPEEIFSFYRARGFELSKLTTQRGNHGCCQYVFKKTSAMAAAF